MPLVSVVMPVYNSEKFVAEAIESILRQTFTDFEFLIVDDGSTDGSLAIIQDYAERDTRIRYFSHAENRGEATARNTGMAHATCKCATGMDSDDVSLPERLEKQVELLESRPDIGAVGISDRTCREDLTLIHTRQLPARHPVIALHLLLFTRTAMRSSPMMLRRVYLERQPIYDPSIIGGSDVDLYLRLISDRRIRYANLPEELYLYRRHEGTMTSRNRAITRKTVVEIRCNALRRLGAAGADIEWIVRKHPLTKLNWQERRQARRDFTRLIEAMVARKWVEEDDESVLRAEMEKLLESTTPRYWQKLLHWYRRRIASQVHR